MQNKRGQGLSTNAIILIVLGVIVLVILIAGFTLGWGQIMPWIKPQNNVDTVNEACKLACNTGKTYDYCFTKRDIFTDEESIKEVSCYYLNKKITKFGIVGCPAIQCDIFEDLTKAQTSCKTTGEQKSYLGATKIETYTCP